MKDTMGLVLKVVTNSLERTRGETRGGTRDAASDTHSPRTHTHLNPPLSSTLHRRCRQASRAYGDCRQAIDTNSCFEAGRQHMCCTRNLPPLGALLGEHERDGDDEGKEHRDGELFARAAIRWVYKSQEQPLPPRLQPSACTHIGSLSAMGHTALDRDHVLVWVIFALPPPVPCA